MSWQTTPNPWNHESSLSYVTRFHAEDGRRKIMVRVTPKAVDLVARMRKEIASDLAGTLANMDRNEGETAEHSSLTPNFRS